MDRTQNGVPLSKDKKKRHCTYILRCSDGTLYTGWTTDLEHRLSSHNAGTGSKYTRSRRPVTLLYYECYSEKSEALKREHAIKKLTRSQKLALIQSGSTGSDSEDL